MIFFSPFFSFSAIFSSFFPFHFLPVSSTFLYFSLHFSTFFYFFLYLFSPFFNIFVRFFLHFFLNLLVSFLLFVLNFHLSSLTFPSFFLHFLPFILVYFIFFHSVVLCTICALSEIKVLLMVNGIYSPQYALMGWMTLKIQALEKNR